VISHRERDQRAPLSGPHPDHARRQRREEDVPIGRPLRRHLNIIADIDKLPGKLNVLRQCCTEIDRDPATLETSCLLTVTLDGYDAPTDIGETRGGRAITGTPDQVADQIKRRVLDVGIDGVIVNLPTHRYTPGVITKVGEVLRPLVDA
jgi:hypothetical protein